MKHWLVAAMATGVVACTTHMETRPGPVAGTGGAIGVPYALPVVHHDLTVTRTLVGCKHARGRITELEFDAKVQHTPRYAAGERFFVDYRKLGNWHKTSGFKLGTYGNQTLKSVNAEADDRSPEMIGSTVKAVLTVAQIATGPSVAVSAGTLLSLQTAALKSTGLDRARLSALEERLREAEAEPTPPANPCPAEVEWMQQASDALKNDADQLLALTRKLDALVVPSLIGLATDEQKKAVAELRRQILAMTEHQATLQKKYDGWAERMRFVESATFTPQPRPMTANAPLEPHTRTFAVPSEDAALRVIQLKQLKGIFGKTGQDTLDADLLTMIRQAATISATLVEVLPDKTVCGHAWLDDACGDTVDPGWKGAGANGRPTALPGIAFRNPVPATLRVCRSEDPLVCLNGATTALLLDTTVSVPQLGRLVILPFQNGFGANNRLEAVFREDGSLDWLAYDVKEASGENAARAFGDSADQVLAWQKQRRADEEAQVAKAEAALEKSQAAPLKALDDQIALLKKQQELAELEALRTSGGATVAQQQELARLQAEVARLTALKQIRELETALANDGAS